MTRERAAESHAVLVADDDTNVRRVLVAMLKREGYEVHAASDGEEAMAILRLHEVSAVVTDLKMPRMDGMALLQHITTGYPDLPVIIITAHGTVETAVQALKLGAFDYVTKPFEKGDLKRTVDKAVRTRSLNREELHASPKAFRKHLIGQSRGMKGVFNIIDKVAATPSTVLISGESGTGKELVAHALHAGSHRAEKPFIKINCAAIPRELMESELFGYEKGAFTGAVTSKPGRFELAHEGTLFLDEIGEIPLEMQVKLLRAIQEQEFERVGGLRTEKVDVRLVAATNRDLQREIALGHFREDLYYRLNVVPVLLPPLRERRDDIPLLTLHFIDKYNKRLHKAVEGITPAAQAALNAYHWPGNIRELENVLERTLLFLEGTLIDLDDLPPELAQRADIPTTVPIPDLHLPAPDSSGLKDLVRETTSLLEKQYIMRALDETGGNVTRAAALLKISRKSLQNKMKEFGLRHD
jgi:two-component system, NtrC family, response regulator AtoC